MESGWTLRLGPLHVHVSALNLLLWALGLAFLGEVVLARGFAPRDANGLRSLLDFGGMPGDVAWAAGADGPRAVLRNREAWRLFSGMFLHGSVVHWLLNTVALLQLGRVAESLFGGGRLLLAFLLTGVAGNLASDAWYAARGEPVICVGASGAICGLIGLLLFQMRRRKDIHAEMYGRYLVQWALLTLLMGLSMPRINNAAHAGGFAAGYLLGAVLLPRDLDPLARAAVRRIRGVATLLLVLAAAASLVVAATGAPRRHRLVTSAELLQRAASSAFDSFEEYPGPATIRQARLAVEAVDVPDALAPAKARAVAALASERDTAEDLVEKLVPVIGEIHAILESAAPDLFG